MQTQSREKATKEKLNGALVQLVRIHACHAWGHGFESRTHREKKSWFILNQDFLFHISGKIKKTGTCRTWHIPVNRVNAYSNTSPFSVYNTAAVLSSASVRTTL